MKRRDFMIAASVGTGTLLATGISQAKRLADPGWQNIEILVVPRGWHAVSKRIQDASLLQPAKIGEARAISIDHLSSLTNSSVWTTGRLFGCSLKNVSCFDATRGWGMVLRMVRFKDHLQKWEAKELRQFRMAGWNWEVRSVDNKCNPCCSATLVKFQYRDSTTSWDNNKEVALANAPSIGHL